MNTQNDLFAHDHDSVSQLLDQMGQIPTPELKAKWPKSLAELCDVLAHELVRQKHAQPEAGLLAGKLAAALAHYMGGRAVYLPTGDTLFQALRNNAIFNEWKGNNIDDLSRKYGLSNPQIYAVIAEQRVLHRKRHQPDMFQE